MKNSAKVTAKDVYIAIKNKRSSMKLSQLAIARQLCISEKAYAKLENGYTALSLDRLIHIAEILNVQPFDLMISNHNLTTVHRNNEKIET